MLVLPRERMREISHRRLRRRHRERLQHDTLPILFSDDVSLCRLQRKRVRFVHVVVDIGASASASVAAQPGVRGRAGGAARVGASVFAGGSVTGLTKMESTHAARKTANTARS